MHNDALAKHTCINKQKYKLLLLNKQNASFNNEIKDTSFH